MKVLIVGSGGREHAIAWSVSRSPKADKIYCAPGNAGIGQVAECVNIGAMEFDKLVAFAKEKEIEERNHRISMIVPGSIMEGTVETLMPYGAFVNLGDGLSGLVHVSQICERRIGKPSEVLKEGQKVKVKVLNTDNGKISLSMRALEEEMVDTSAEEAESISDYTSNEAASTSLGDLLKNFKLN